MIYDPYKNRFTPRQFLEKAKREFGRIDQFWFWHSYPRVGVDPRDQFDLYKDLPGGIKGLREFISTCHSIGTHVFLPYNPWDRIQKRKDMYKKQAEILGAVGADGLHLDTMDKADSSLRTEIDKYNPEAQFVTEGRPSIEGLQFTTESSVTRSSIVEKEKFGFFSFETSSFSQNQTNLLPNEFYQ